MRRIQNAKLDLVGAASPCTLYPRDKTRPRRRRGRRTCERIAAAAACASCVDVALLHQGSSRGATRPRPCRATMRHQPAHNGVRWRLQCLSSSAGMKTGCTALMKPSAAEAQGLRAAWSGCGRLEREPQRRSQRSADLEPSRKACRKAIRAVDGSRRRQRLIELLRDTRTARTLLAQASIYGGKRELRQV